ncbi:MAG TPA: radical SAM protein [Gammaproteobacteria bacterium]|nr:radical SAM protein [Gammaproteobacteria bacterium]
MHATLPLMIESDFPPLEREKLTTLQVNLGYRCNQQCQHCHVDAGPKRREEMNHETIDDVIAFMSRQQISTLDLTGGAPELNKHFRYLVEQAVALGVHVMDRCNLTILSEPDQEELAEFLAENGVEVFASMPCYLEENVNRQRGKGVYQSSINGLKMLNELGYGKPGSGLELNLVYNPTGPSLPPAQQQLEIDYKARMGELGIVFNQLLTLSNMPIKRFGSMLISKGQFDEYMDLLRQSHQDSNLATVMCRNLISVDWQGHVYDCDFNQMLDMPMLLAEKHRPHLSELMDTVFTGCSIDVADHCYGCTAGQGSSCSGALS